MRRHVNAVRSVCARLAMEQIIRLVKKYFGSISGVCKPKFNKFGDTVGDAFSLSILSTDLGLHASTTFWT